MFRNVAAGLCIVLVWLLFAGSAVAQEPRPTPTNVAPPGGGGTEDDDQTDKRGSISGFIYEDVNWDGRCVNTGVSGERPVQGVNVQFVSSDRETVITHYSGANGDFGLYAAGQSYWEITALPASGWTVTSERTVYVPVYIESLNHENINFCVARGTNAVINLPGIGVPGNATVLLPESGASTDALQVYEGIYWLVAVTAVIGLAFFLAGYYLQQHPRHPKKE